MMILIKYFTTLLLLSSISMLALAQNDTTRKYTGPVSVDEPQITQQEQVYDFVTEHPQFIAGDYSNHKFSAYIQSKLIYPKEAMQKGIQGKVYVQYVVDTAGMIREVKILRGITELNQAALDAFKNAPTYARPGYRNGIPVNVRIALSIIFKLE